MTEQAREWQVGDVIEVALSRGGTIVEIVWRIDPKGSMEAYPWQDRGLLRTAYKKNGAWKATWRWPCDPGVKLIEDQSLVGEWFAHILITGDLPLKGIEL